ncbi:MAG: glucose-6-phosphate dehydrogenase [Candidatus Andersenbacteria bacterium]|nr:glucose-6-phosphate dehydrogenase [Candidatus Andersenbacteria bacterium]
MAMTAQASAGREVLPTVLVIFGATGDLARRKLMPALWQLYQAGQLPPLLQVVGYSRKALGEAAWQSQVREIVAHGGASESVESFSRLFVYQAGLFEDAAGYRALARRLGRQDEQWRTCANKLFYLAVPPQYYQTIFQHLADSGLTEPCSPEEGWTRVVVEKPFGKDLATAQELDARLGRLFREEQIYRIDHYLGKDTVRNILAFRFSNAFLEPAWDSRSIDRIHIYFGETGDVGSRGAFYDGVGALRDVGQNHMLQVLALLTMENPGAFDADSIRTERARVLEALEIMDEQDVARQTVRGQYEGYRQAPDVAPDSATETYFKVLAHLNSSRWRGVPIVFESGKALNEAKFEVAVTFRHQTPCLCPLEAGKHYTNVLTYRIQPHEGVTTTFWVKRPGDKMVIEEKEFSFDYAVAFGGEAFIDAYAKLLLDVIRGDQTLFVSTDEIMSSWRFVDPIERAWQQGVVPLRLYRPGSAGPPYAKAAGGKAGWPDKKIGFIGLGKMGANMVERLFDHDWQVVAADPNAQARARAKKFGAQVVKRAAAVARQLSAPRVVWLMVPHGAVDGVLEELVPHLHEGDVVIDGGNSFYKDSVQRAAELRRRGIAFLDVGVSGGPSGARKGACLMVGGEREVYKRLVGLLADLSVAAGFDYIGASGAGHFVKMVHNGIEYGMMQALAEGFAVMKASDFELDLERVAHLYNHGSVIESALVGWLKDAYDKFGPEMEGVFGAVAHSGEGQWTVEVARELGVPVRIIEDALQFRVESQASPAYTGRLLTALRHMFGGHRVNDQ